MNDAINNKLLDQNVQLLNLKNLTRILFTNTLDLNTPKIVIVEVAESCKIKIFEDELDKEEYRSKVIKILNNYTNYIDIDFILDLDKNTNINDLNETQKKYIKQLASFININSTWSLGSLKKAYLNLISILDTEYNLSNQICFGNQTPDKLNSFNYCTCYFLCKKYNINLNYNTSKLEIHNHIKIISKPEYLKSFLYHRLDNIDILRNLYSNYVNTYIDKNNKNNIDISNLNIAYNTYKNTNKNVLYKLSNLNTEESIVIAFLLYDLDISYCKNPIIELSNLNIWNNHYNSYIFQNNNFHLLDSEIDKIFQKNKYLFQYSKNFNVLFPFSFYGNTKIRELYEKEIVYFQKDHIVSSYYQELQYNNCCNTFYEGFHLGIVNKFTIIENNDIYSEDNDNIVCYGVKNQNMNAYLYTELIDIFRIDMNFVLPDIGTLDENSVNKLIYLCSDSKNENKKKLLRVIEDVKLSNDVKGSVIKQLLKFYQNTDNKDLILELIEKLLHLGMKMRGWLGIENFPLKTALVDNPSIVDLNVSIALQEFETSCKKLGKNSNLILDFPLMKYNKGFQFSNDKEDGKTLGERIQIIKDGENTDNISSCIRLSSNYISTTAHKMYTTLGLKEPFEIQNLRSIS